MGEQTHNLLPPMQPHAHTERGQTTDKKQITNNHTALTSRHVSSLISNDVFNIDTPANVAICLNKHHRTLMDKSCFSFNTSRCSRAAVSSSSVIWYGSIDKNASLMWKCFISFDTVLSAHLPYFFRGRCPHYILWKIRNHLLKVVNNGHPNLPCNGEIEFHEQVVVLILQQHLHILAIFVHLCFLLLPYHTCVISLNNPHDRRLSSDYHPPIVYHMCMDLSRIHVTTDLSVVLVKYQGSLKGSIQVFF